MVLNHCEGLLGVFWTALAPLLVAEYPNQFELVFCALAPRALFLDHCEWKNPLCKEEVKLDVDHPAF